MKEARKPISSLFLLHGLRGRHSEIARSQDMEAPNSSAEGPFSDWGSPEIAATGRVSCGQGMHDSCALDQVALSSGAKSLPRSIMSPHRAHILYIIDELCRLGGAERALRNTIRLLPKDRFNCSLITFRADPSLEVFSSFPCLTKVLPLRRTYDSNALQVAMQIRKVIRSQRVSIVHTFFETSDLWGAPIAKLSGCPIMVSSRRDMGILRRPKHQLAYRFVNPLFDRVIAVSEQVRSYCIHQDRLDPAKVVTVYNGVDLNETPMNGTDSLRRALGVGEASEVVVTLGHIRRVKGIDIFVRAAEIVRREFPAAKFLVVGDTSETEHAKELQELITALGLQDTVKFAGNRLDAFRILKCCDVFCLLSRSEGFSNALIEAMAAGLPCVATRVGGNGEAIAKDESGYLVENEDVRGAAERILHLLRNPSRAREMGAAGRRTVETKFTSQAMIQQLTNIYDGLLNSQRR